MIFTICSRLDTYLRLCSQPDFTGVFEICNNSGASWKLRFLSGQLVADAGGIFPLQRWQRQVKRYLSNVPLEQFHYPPSLAWNSQALNELISSNVISQKQASKMLGSSVCEILFEVALQELNQGSDISINNYRANWKSVSSFEEAPLVSLDITKVWPEVMKLVERWDQSGLKSISPSSVPLVLNRELLSQLTCDTDFDRLVSLLDDNCTLWELAARLKCSIYSITRTIISLEQRQCIKFAEVSAPSDKETVIQEIKNSTSLENGFIGVSAPSDEETIIQKMKTSTSLEIIFAGVSVPSDGEIFIQEMKTSTGSEDIPTVIAL
ncbi:MAG: hypothetical protein AAGC93_31770 [Cyanobacteria bacterium P01_F01_bin.53]